MINLNTYIIEKLKINKNTKFIHLINEGDTIGAISISRSNKDSKRIELLLFEPFKVINFDDKSLEYEVNSYYQGNKSVRKVSQSVYSNSKGFIQDNDYINNDYRRSIYLERKDVVEFLKKLLKRNIDNVDLVHEYFDHLDCFDFDKLQMEVRDCRFGVINTIKTKGIKEILSLYEED